MTISLRDHEPETRCSHVAAAARRTADEIVVQDLEPAVALRSLRPWLADEDHLVATTPTVHALYGDALADLLDLVERHAEALIRTGFRTPRGSGRAILWRAAGLMLEQLAQNPCEDQGHERLVDFGHTFSPLLEAASRRRLSRGEAVSIGMAVTMALSAELGLVAPASRDRILALLRRLGLPVTAPLLTPDLCRRALEQAVLHRGGRPNLVLPADSGPSRFLDDAGAIGADALARALRAVADASAPAAPTSLPLARPGRRLEAGGLRLAGS